MADDKTTIDGQIAGLTVHLEWKAAAKAWDLHAIAPAIPGVIVALAGLWISHFLTGRREARKELLTLCDEVKDKLEAAVEAGISAWISDTHEDERLLKVKEAKRKLQSLGASVTTLKRRSSVGWWGQLKRQIWCNKPAQIDVLTLVAELRREITSDPFEDPDRASDATRADEFSALAGSIASAIDRDAHAMLN